MKGRTIAVLFLVVTLLLSCSTRQSNETKYSATTLKDAVSEYYVKQDNGVLSFENGESSSLIPFEKGSGKTSLSINTENKSGNLSSSTYSTDVYGYKAYGEVSDTTLSFFTDISYYLTEEDFLSFLTEVFEGHEGIKVESHNVYKSGFFLSFSSSFDREYIINTLIDDFVSFISVRLYGLSEPEIEEVVEVESYEKAVEEVVVEADETSLEIVETEDSLSEDKTIVETEAEETQKNEEIIEKEDPIVEFESVEEIPSEVMEEETKETLETEEEKETETIEEPPVVEEEYEEVRDEEEENEESIVPSIYITEEIRECIMRIVVEIFSYGK